MGKVIGVISIKGGVGKTTTVVNLGAAFANVLGKKTLIVDANFTAPNLGLHIGLVTPDDTLHDVLNKSSEVADAIYESEYGFDILPGKLQGEQSIDYNNLKKHIDDIRDDYDVVLLDSSPNLNNEILATMIAADELLVVTTPDYPTLSTTLHAVKVAKDQDTPITGLVLNRVLNKKFELTIDDIEDASDTPVLSVLPFDVSIVEALSKTMPAIENSPKRDAVVEYSKLAAAIIGERYSDNRIFNKIRSLFSRTPSKTALNRELLYSRDLEEK